VAVLAPAARAPVPALTRRLAPVPLAAAPQRGAVPAAPQAARPEPTVPAAEWAARPAERTPRPAAARVWVRVRELARQLAGPSRVLWQAWPLAPVVAGPERPPSASHRLWLAAAVLAA